MNIDPASRIAIDNRVKQVLRDAGAKEPPVIYDDVLGALKVHRDFYDLSDPGLLQRIQHRIRVEGSQLIKLVKKVKLNAIWAPDENRILIDHQLPIKKQVWAGYHDAAHRMIPWHRDLFLGDTARTLAPEYHEELEAEANYGGSGLMFCGEHFTIESRDMVPEWSSIQKLAKRYGSSLTTALRRFVSHGPNRSMVALICTPPWSTEHLEEARARHVVVSELFRARFATLHPDVVVALMEGNLGYRRKGLIAQFESPLETLRGDLKGFKWQVFDNTHDLLVFAVEEAS